MVPARLPGIDPAKDVEITVTEGVLTLRSERSEETTEKHRTKIPLRSTPAPSGCQAGAKGDEAAAEYKDGVLTITVPVPETKTGTRTIRVSTGRSTRTRRVAPCVRGRAGSAPAVHTTDPAPSTGRPRRPSRKTPPSARPVAARVGPALPTFLGGVGTVTGS